MRDCFIKELSRMAETDPRIMLITGDLGFCVLDEYRERFPDQFINAGVAEQNMAGLACGLALEGYVVFYLLNRQFCFYEVLGANPKRRCVSRLQCQRGLYRWRL